jgi:hypothetical protein
LSGNKVTLEVETSAIKEVDLRAKFYCRNENNTYVSKDLSLKNGQVSFETEEVPYIVNASILSTIDGETIDRRGYDYRYPTKEEGVILEEDEMQLIDIISKGENETTEFKITLEPQNQREFLETIVAFANTYGGRVFIGVNDNGAVKDFRENIRVKIEDMIHDNCSPEIEVDVRPAQIGEHQILIVEVLEGENKPYLYTNHGIYIRRGSSDRQINRMELDDLYAKKNQGYMGTTLTWASNRS